MSFEHFQHHRRFRRIDQRLTREWVTEETGEVGSVGLSFDLDGISLPTGVMLRRSKDRRSLET